MRNIIDDIDDLTSEIEKSKTKVGYQEIIDLMYYRAVKIRELYHFNSAMDSLEIVPKIFDPKCNPYNIVQLIVELNIEGVEIPLNLLGWLKSLGRKHLSKPQLAYVKSRYPSIFIPDSFFPRKNLYKLKHSSDFVKYNYLFEPTVKCFDRINQGSSGQIHQSLAVAAIKGSSWFNLRSALITGGSSIVVLPGKKFFCEHFETSYSNKVKFNHDNLLIHFSNPVAYIKKISRYKRLPTGINLLGAAHGHFSHFLFNAFIKLISAHLGGINLDTPVIVEEDLPDSMEELILHFGFKKIVRLSAGQSLQVDNLVQGTNYTFLPDIRNSMKLENTTNTLDSRFFSIFRSLKFGNNEFNFENLYIPRINSTWGRISGEDSLIEKFKKQGFFIASPEKMNYESQVNLFKKAKIIVTSPGSALANLIYCKSGTQVHILADSRVHNYVGWLGPMSELGIKFYWHPILEKQSESPHTDFKFENDVIDRFLRELKYDQSF